MSNEIKLSSVEFLNWGVYNFTIQITEESFRTKVTTKMFVLSSSAFNSSLFADLNKILDSWVISSNFEIKNSNGDDLDMLQREYLAFYASQALAKATHIRDFFFANSSLTIIGLISFFSIIAAMLVAVIIYKHYYNLIKQY